MVLKGARKSKAEKNILLLIPLDCQWQPRCIRPIHDSVGAINTIKQLRYIFPRLKRIIADGGYRGKLADTVKDFGWELSVVLRPDESSKKFEIRPLRWSVERTFSWIENYRRMTTDYEYKTDYQCKISCKCAIHFSFRNNLLK